MTTFPNLSLLAISSLFTGLTDGELEKELGRCEELRLEKQRRREQAAVPELQKETNPDKNKRDAGGSEHEHASSEQLPAPKMPRKTPSNWLVKELDKKWNEVLAYGWPPTNDIELLYPPFSAYFVNKPIPPSDFDDVVREIILGKSPTLTSVLEKQTSDGFHVSGKRDKDVMYFPQHLPKFDKKTVPTWSAETWVKYLYRWFLIRKLYEVSEGGSAGATR